MASETHAHAASGGRFAGAIFGALVVLGAAAFAVGLSGSHPERAWQAFLINFLLWTGVAAGSVLFSAVMRVTGARWSDPMAGVAESFAAFFPVSLVLFPVLFFGGVYVFPWTGADLHGKEVWLNLPFLFVRDLAALVLLYGVGAVYLSYSMRIRIGLQPEGGGIRAWLRRRWAVGPSDRQVLQRRAGLLAGLYCLCFTLVLSLIGYDLVMALDPFWVSTLFGAYCFVKAFYVGLGALIIAAAVLYLRKGEASGLLPSHFHDVGKLFFAFCLVWGDFFYAQFLVIWYGNISEETAYVIERTLTAPWSQGAWIVLGVCFVLPFLILLNRRIKTLPVGMIVLCGIVIAGMWLEHLLLVGPALSRHAERLPFGISDALISVGFLGLLLASLGAYQKTFPEIASAGGTEAG